MHDPFDVHLVDTSNDIAEEAQLDCPIDLMAQQQQLAERCVGQFHHMEADQHRQRGLIDCDSDAGAVGVEELDHVAALAQSFEQFPLMVELDCRFGMHRSVRLEHLHRDQRPGSLVGGCRRP